MTKDSDFFCLGWYVVDADAHYLDLEANFFWRVLSISGKVEISSTTQIKTECDHPE